MLRLDNALNCITNNDKPSAATLRAADPIRVEDIQEQELDIVMIAIVLLLVR